MNLKNTGLTILSVFCLLTIVPSVYSHDVEGAPGTINTHDECGPPTTLRWHRHTITDLKSNVRSPLWYEGRYCPGGDAGDGSSGGENEIPTPTSDTNTDDTNTDDTNTDDTNTGDTNTGDTNTSGNPQDTTTESVEGTSSPQPVGPVATGSAPQERRPVSPPIQPLRVTEYMVRDWSTGLVVGNSNLPQWIELHNPNTEAVNLKGYTFQYATRRFRNQPYEIHTLTLAATAEDEFSIPGGGVVILATQRLPARKFSRIEAEQVYNLNIENVLKRGWVLKDAKDSVVHHLGREAFSALSDPVAPPHQDGARVSHHAYRSESPSEPYYYGDSKDIGSPGFYEQPAPAAPSAVRRKQVGTWASLKRIP